MDHFELTKCREIDAIIGIFLIDCVFLISLIFRLLNALFFSLKNYSTDYVSQLAWICIWLVYNRNYNKHMLRHKHFGFPLSALFSAPYFYWQIYEKWHLHFHFQFPILSRFTFKLYENMLAHMRHMFAEQTNAKCCTCLESQCEWPLQKPQSNDWLNFMMFTPVSKKLHDHLKLYENQAIYLSSWLIWNLFDNRFE